MKVLSSPAKNYAVILASFFFQRTNASPSIFHLQFYTYQANIKIIVNAILIKDLKDFDGK